MTADQRRRHAMLVRVRDFAQAHRARYAHVAVAVQYVAAVDAALSTLDECAAAHFTSARGASAERTAARAALIAALMVICRTARIIAIEVPRARLFLVPRFRTDRTLVTLGRAFVRDTGPLTNHFVALGMRPTFVEELESLVDAFDTAVRASEVGKGARIAARVGADVALAQATAAVRRLDVVLLNLLGHDALVTVQWRRARWVGSRRRRSAFAKLVRARMTTIATPEASSRGDESRHPVHLRRLALLPRGNRVLCPVADSEGDPSRAELLHRFIL